MARVALPIDPELPRIVERVEECGRLVLVAEPGAGKTTRVPAALLEGLRGRGEILVLQPRRLATRMAARRVAEELGEPVGRRVGYTVRHEDVGSRDTRLRFVTEAVLSRRLVADPELRGVDAVVLDELHERSIHADVALALVRRLRRTSRPDLRLVAMSATLDADRVARFLDAEVIHVRGRPNEVLIEHAESRDERPLEEQIRGAVRRLLQEGLDGHVLAFVPGAAEIRRGLSALEGVARDQDLELLPLHGELGAEEQDRAVRPSTRRKIILATNVAETSITIDGVVAVIDSGLERAASFSPWSGATELVTAAICQASAIQRAGRAGRTQKGKALRLYTRHDYDTRPAFLEPEIRRSDLAETRLLLGMFGVRRVTADDDDDPRALPLLDVPAAASIENAEATLRAIDALDATGDLTKLGRDLAGLPLTPRLARVAYEATRLGSRRRGAWLAAALAEKEPRLDQRVRLGDGPRSSVESGPSDALARLELVEAVAEGGLHASRIRAHGLDVGTTLSIGKSAEALDRALRPLEQRMGAPSAFVDEDTALLRALLSGFADRVAKRRRPRQPEVLLAGGGSLRLAERSVVREAEWLVCVEALKTRGGLECTVGSAIEPEWLLDAGPERLRDTQAIRFDREKERIEAVSSLEYLGLVLDASRRDAAGLPGAAEVLATAALQTGLGRFVDRHALDQLQLRVAAARRVDPSVPALDDEVVRVALVEACEGRRSLVELEGAGVLDLIEARLGAGRAKLDRLAPTHVALPGRPRVAVTYEHDRPPWIESRMQDFFGLAEGPAAGGQPIVLHLLAPNQRAVQVTTDLAGFWERHYPKLRRELMRTYPRHFWPEDPLHAEPPPPRRR